MVKNNKENFTSSNREGKRRNYSTNNWINHENTTRIKRLEDKIEGLEDKIKILEGKNHLLEKELTQEKTKWQKAIHNQVNWGIRTISYTSVIISLGLTMILAIIALTFKSGSGLEIGIGALIGIICLIFVLLSGAYAFMVWWINKMIIHRKSE